MWVGLGWCMGRRAKGDGQVVVCIQACVHAYVCVHTSTRLVGHTCACSMGYMAAPCRVEMRVTQRHPLDIIELPPLPLPSLNEAMTEEQHQELLTEEQRKVGIQRRPGLGGAAFPCLQHVPADAAEVWG